MTKTTYVLSLFLLGAMFQCVAVEVPADTRDPSPFTFQKDDVVAIIGNGLPDRFQHDGWFETALQRQLVGLNVRFRNMSASGDLVDSIPRSQGFMSPSDYLRHVGADVVFAFFGYNESYDGVDKAANYQRRLVDMVRTVRAAQPNGKTFPRLVLFSPIAFENTGNPNLPQGTDHNARLAAYADATRLAAQEAGVAYVDIYSHTFQMFESSDANLTINGAHLNEEGNRRLAEYLATTLCGKPVKLGPKQEALRAAVLDKNWNWHTRYRATDGNDIWGGRSGLSFVGGQRNAEVRQHELVMLDGLTANRDQKIWAVAQGKSFTVDDSNIPAPIPVISNVGGGSPSSSADKEGRGVYLSPEESLKKIKVPEGYALNVFASEELFPDFANPVQLQVDTRGRLWAASWNSYPKWEPLTELKDSLMIFEDSDGDGVADKRIRFATVHNPAGFAFWNGGVIVTRGPDLLFLKDTDGDDKADVREVLLQGLGTEDTHHAANNLIFGPGGGIYWQSGIFLVNNHEHPWGRSLHTTDSAMYRFDPRRFTINVHAGNSPNPHGTSFDYWGYCYANDGTGGNSFQVRPEGHGFRMHRLLNTGARPVAGNVIISSSNFPEHMQGNFAACNTIGFLGLKTFKLHRGGVADPDRAAGHVWGSPLDPLIQSEDRNFRPTSAIFGEDGALYVADWQNQIIGHMQHNVRDPNRDHLHGRIWRLTYTNRPMQKAVQIDGQPIVALLENLKHPVDGVRQRTQVELSERDSDEVITAAREWVKPFDPTKELDAHHMLEALWLHQQHNVRNEPLLNALLASPIEHARIAAGTVKHYWFKVDATSGRVYAAAAETEKAEVVSAPARLSKSEARQYVAGAEVFKRDAHCSTCHQPDGKGMPNLYPPLVGSPWVVGNEERLIKLTLHGLWGKIEVNGSTYDPAKGIPPMTAFGAILTDHEIADVLTYVRNSWENEAPAVSPKTVKRVREANSDRSIFWKPEELLEVHPLDL
ncbi:MAG: GDSL-type esterase/lipase family protein [Verrucomicrobia bacterium]|nr:GDSL-type esterase/lipase family protein [Verrucomicrobiota bacterium]